MSRLNAVLVSLFLHLPLAVHAETYLLMAEEQGCYWCGRWNVEVSTIYPKTAEGEAAPLRRYDLQGEAPDGVTFVRSVVYTPTFILVEDGKEIGRIEGYPGEDFFWGLLAKMLDDAGIATTKPGQES